MNSPANPGQKIRGRKAAKVVAVEDIIGSAIFFEDSPYAWTTVRPSLSFLSAYSTTTIAPSTRRPTDKIKAKRTTILIVKPIMERANKPDKKEPGIDTPTSKPDLTPRAPSIIIKTSIIAAITLFWRLFNIVLIPFDWSLPKEISTLSGGNMQKLLMGRELISNPDVIIAAQPTRGLDVSAVDSIHNLIIDQRDKGSAILLISEDLDELFKLSDRLIVMYEGKVVIEIETELTSESSLSSFHLDFSFNSIL